MVDRDRHLGGLARLTQRLLEIEEVDCALVLARMGRKTHLVARSRTPEVDVGALARQFGGGGHRGAASATAVEIKDSEVLDFLQNSFPAARRAADIMTRKVEVLEADQGLTAAEAVEELRRLGHTAVCVTRGGRVVGMLARSDLDKALAHNMGGAEATRFMTTKILSVAPDTPVNEIRRLLVRRDIGRVPVMEGDEMVGLVSRTDVLAAAEEGEAQKAGAQDVAGELLRLDSHTLDYLRCLGILADSRELPTYIVGGFVRDLVLGVESQGPGPGGGRRRHRVRPVGGRGHPFSQASQLRSLSDHPAFLSRSPLRGKSTLPVLEPSATAGRRPNRPSRGVP